MEILCNVFKLIALKSFLGAKVTFQVIHGHRIDVSHGPIVYHYQDSETLAKLIANFAHPISISSPV